MSLLAGGFMAFDYKKMLHKEFNVGSKETRIRYGVGIALLLISVFMANILFLLVGVVLVVTAKIQWCPIYSGMGKSTVEPGEEPPVSKAH